MLKLYRGIEFSKMLLNNSVTCRHPLRYLRNFPLVFAEDPTQNRVWELSRINMPYSLQLTRSLKIGTSMFSEAGPSVETGEEENKPSVDPSKDRSRKIDPETSIRYLKSKAYKTTYGEEPVWVKYRRNFKGHYIPKKTRLSCIRNNVITTGNPCPICRDEYLVLHYTNIDLLKQFIHPQTGQIHDTRKTHICRRKLLELEVAIEKAKFYGLLTYDVPFRKYDYKEYYPDWENQ